jgi:hypothetical protein
VAEAGAWKFTRSASAGAASSLTMVSVAAAPPRVAPPVGALNARDTVSSPSTVVSPTRVTAKVFVAVSPAAHESVPLAAT